MNNVFRTASCLVGAIASLCLVSVAGAQMTTSTYDFEGIGARWTYTGEGKNAVYWGNVEFSGTIVLTVDPAGATVYGTNEANTNTYGWVFPTFDIQWANGSFSSQRLVGETYFDNAVVIYDNKYDPLRDMIFFRHRSNRQEAGLFEQNQAYVQLYTFDDLTFVQGLAFPIGADLKLAPERPGGDVNRLRFTSITDNNGNWTGFEGEMQLTSLLYREQDPAVLLANLLASVTGVGSGYSLINKISLAIAYEDAGDTAATCAVMKDFDSAVSAQTGKKITSELAQQLIESSGQVQVLTGCP